MTTRLAGTMALAAALAGTLPAQAQVAGPHPALTELSASLEATVHQVEPAVVEIVTTAYAPANSADLVTTQRSSGSGVIVDPEGYVVTNAHVVRGANRLRVELMTAVASTSILSARSRTVPASCRRCPLPTPTS